MATVILGPAQLDLSGIRAGDRNTIAMTISFKGEPLDLTGLQLSAQARKTPSDPAIAVTAVIAIVDAPNGQITITWPGADVSSLFTGGIDTWAGVWDLQVGSGGNITTIAAGKLQAVLDVTRP
jgi:hypothetical protein